MKLNHLLIAGCCATVFLPCAASAEDGLPFPGPAISRTTTSDSNGQLLIGNNTLIAAFQRADNSLRLASLRSPLNGFDVIWSDPNLFTIYLTGNAKPLASSAMKLVGEPEAHVLIGTPGAARLAQRLPGQEIRATFTDESTGLEIRWSAAMTDGANYLHQEISLRATRGPVSVDHIEMIHAALPGGAKVSGNTDGSPVITDKLFLGVEHPMSRNTAEPYFAAWTPSEMQRRQFDVQLTDIAAGDMRVQFNFQRGNHRINVVKVALLDVAGKTVAEDVHAGYSGDQSLKNTYHFAVPHAAAYAKLRVFLGGDAKETSSWGTVAVSGATAPASSDVVCSLPRQCALEPGATWTVSSGIGVYLAGQLRRAFLCYLERERAHPYRQYWHYNSWYDLNIDRNDIGDPLQRMNEAQCLDVIRAFGRELYDKRGVGLDGFVWDDGWDDWNSLWGFHKGFPNGFTRLKEEAAKQGAGMGAWLSPWGGYGGSHNARVRMGKEKGYETNYAGFSMGGPKYRAAFRDVCLKMIHDYNQNYFKFDGIGNGTDATGVSVGSAPDLDGLMSVLGDLRRANPDVFINCTVGTWPSPYWTWFADSVWRGGGDCNYAGEGNFRERWITYRDERLYVRIANPCPLYPLNSLMYHGLLVGNRATPSAMPKPAENIDSYRHEVQMSVACGSGLGELYVTPGMLTPKAWDILAAGIKWSRAHRDILRDTHWVGGRPSTEVYGYASWHPQQGGTLVLRNPTSTSKTFSLDVAKVLELPEGVSGKFAVASAFAETPSPIQQAEAGKPIEIGLEPFEVLVLELKPQN